LSTSPPQSKIECTPLGTVYVYETEQPCTKFYEKCDMAYDKTFIVLDIREKIKTNRLIVVYYEYGSPIIILAQIQSYFFNVDFEQYRTKYFQFESIIRYYNIDWNNTVQFLFDFIFIYSIGYHFRGNIFHCSLYSQG
jgi:hypothetical protein